MRFWTIPVLAGLLIAAASGVGFAIPSLDGPTGIVTVPNAYVAPMKSLQTALSYQKFRNLVSSSSMYDASTSEEDMTAWSLQALTGVADKAELWAAYQQVRNEQSSHIWGIGGKVQLTKEPEEAASLAVGASYQDWVDAFTESIDDGETAKEDVKVWKAYIAASKNFTPVKGEKWEWGPGGGTQMLGTAGLLYLKADATDFSESLTRPFLAVEFVSAAGTTLGLEYRWKDDTLDDKAVFSAALRYKFSPEFTAEVGTTNANPVGTGLDDQEIFVRLGYNIPMKGLY
jgi:IS1 family transposase